MNDYSTNLQLHTSTDTYFWAVRLFGPDLPPAQTEVRFHPTRKWRFDVAYPGRVAVEIDGATRAVYKGPRGRVVGGRHNSAKDREKLNTAAAMGWRVLRFTPEDIYTDPERCIALVRQTLQTPMQPLQED